MNQNPFDQSGPPSRPPGAPAPFDPNKAIAVIVAILTTIILGPLAADHTSAFMEGVFLKLYGPDLAGFMTGVWKAGMYILVGLLAQIFVYTAVLFLVSWAGMRLLPAMM